MGHPDYNRILQVHGKLPKALHYESEFDKYRNAIETENKALKEENSRYKAEVERLLAELKKLQAPKTTKKRKEE